MSAVRSLARAAAGPRGALWITVALLLCLGSAPALARPPIAVALVGGQNDHDWKTSNAFLLALLRKEAGLTVTEENAPAEDAPADAWNAWRPGFAKYDCVIVNYTGPMWPDAVKRDFEQYLSGGGGVIVLHSANSAFTGWEAFEKAVGLLGRPASFGSSLYFDKAGRLQREARGGGRATGQSTEFDWAVTVRGGRHPITAGMPKRWIHVHDELFHGQRGPAQKVQVLLSAFSEPANGGTGRDEPILWWVPHGKGKVVTNLMGHVGQTDSLSCVGYQTALVRSIEWVATGQVTTGLPADFPGATRGSQNYPLGPPKILPENLSKAEALKRFKLPPGYRIELVASEPMIENPVTLAWDGDGRLFVAEMRTYMADADATGEDEPRSRVSMLTDADGDGVLDKATVFADGLVLPRMVLPLDDRIVIAETYTGAFVSYRDSNGDGRADEKVVVYQGDPSRANLEHQDSGLLWGIDNRLYTAQMGNRRFRVGKDGKWQSEPMYGRASQWGLAMDDVGRLFGSAGGQEVAAVGFQQHPSYGPLSLEGEIPRAFNEIFPRLQVVDVQGGLPRVHPLKGIVNHITGCGGQCIFRGDRLPADMEGDYILPEPVGRLIRRAKIESQAGKRVLVNAYPGDEFISSTDPTFRPVWAATGPDGCLYIADMNRGIIQQGNWTRPNSYLRSIIDRDGHARYVGHGRIYRVVHEGHQPGPRPAMLQQNPAALVAHLSHPNGWWRDTAQKLLVLRGDRGVVPALKTLARSGSAPLGRLHALWTLDGLEATDRALLTGALADRDQRVRAAAVRISESLLRTGDAALVGTLAPLAQDPAIDVVVQLASSLRFINQDPAARVLLTKIAGAHPDNELVAASTRQSLRYDPKRPRPINDRLNPQTQALVNKGREHYNQVCYACHGPDGRGVISGDGQRLAPTLIGGAIALGTPDAAVRVVLHGLTGGLDGKTYPGPMLPMRDNSDQWIAEVLTYVRNDFGNSAPAITAADVKRVRNAAGERVEPYTLAELKPFVPLQSLTTRVFVLRASHRGGDVRKAFDGDLQTRWTTEESQTAGQWFEIDMTQPFQLSRIRLDTTPSQGDYPRGWEVRVRDDGQDWSPPVAKGQGAGALLDIEFPGQTTARYVRIIQTDSGKTGLFWSIHELSVYGEQKKTITGSNESAKAPSSRVR